MFQIMNQLESKVLLLQDASITRNNTIPKSPPRITSSAHQYNELLLITNNINNSRTVFELPDDSSQSVSQQSCIIAWDDLIELEEAKGWEEDYIKATKLAISNNNGKPTLPNLLKKWNVVLKQSPRE
jgi:hypothetical protein